ncbi:hypothetical protein [Catenulispora rubra]|uniref:hypothetical protein n=1 Tax=Catenulispora rubra TaxID=280293 RepID=UPI0018927DE3|nr:hypothetical protein [Catenulispora rubra]
MSRRRRRPTHQHDHHDPSPNEEGTIGGVAGGNGPGPASDDAQARDRSGCWYCGSFPPGETNTDRQRIHNGHKIRPALHAEGPATVYAR